MSNRSYCLRASFKSDSRLQENVNSPTQRSPLSDISNVTSPGDRRKLRKQIMLSKKSNNTTSFRNVGVNLHCQQNSSQLSEVINISNNSNLSSSFINASSSLHHLSSVSDVANSSHSLLPTSGRYSIQSSIIRTTNHSMLSGTSSLTRLSSGKSNLKHKPHDKTPIPMVSLDSDDDSSVVRINQDPFKGISKDYLDHGDQVLICEICSAKLWTSEGGKGRITLERLTYSLCCVMVDHKINKGNAPFIYRISGQNYHCIGSLRPSNGQHPKFSQLYIYDTENEITNRQTVFSDPTQPSSSTDKDVDVQIIEYLRDLLDSQNMLVQTYRKVRDHFHGSPEANLKLRFIYKRDKDGRACNLPSTSKVVALIVGDVNESIDHRDIVVETQSGVLQRISELHPSYLALQYPILLPYGDDGYRIDNPHKDFMSTKRKKNKVYNEGIICL
ncbi:uncharacterized protein LOC110892502 [Helianthus annuus]|uniref:uncharacterized protein LOC110892502 n=1 Tax=Helianthus annuus TaxID=4232 RepID=UPI0016532626|nr:uncharacterized protein LOC110892502 [Helianthus annuus]